MPDPPACPDAVRMLVERFEYHRPAYLRGQYNETQLRREFIDPFFKALNWDVDNREGLLSSIHVGAKKVLGFR